MFQVLKKYSVWIYTVRSPYRAPCPPPTWVQYGILRLFLYRSSDTENTW